MENRDTYKAQLRQHEQIMTDLCESSLAALHTVVSSICYPATQTVSENHQLYCTLKPTILCQCFDAVGWASSQKKTEWWDAGMVICQGRGADLHMAQLMPLPLTVSCSSKSRLVLPSWLYLSGNSLPR